MSFCPLISNAEKKAECSNDCSFHSGKHGCLFRLQVKPLDEQKQAENTETQTKPFEFIRNCDLSRVLSVIQFEYPLFIAIVLSYLEPSKASVLLENLPRDKRGEVAYIIATLGGVSIEIIRGIEQSVKRKLSNYDYYGTSGGVDSILEILEPMYILSNDEIMSDIRSKDPLLADEMQRRRFEATKKTPSDNEVNDLLDALNANAAGNDND